jgi:hypothetical protein
MRRPGGSAGGQIIFKKGDAGDSLFAIALGTVKIEVPSRGGRDAVFGLLQELRFGLPL